MRTIEKYGLIVATSAALVACGGEAQEPAPTPEQTFVVDPAAEQAARIAIAGNASCELIEVSALSGYDSEVAHGYAGSRTGAYEITFNVTPNPEAAQFMQTYDGDYRVSWEGPYSSVRLRGAEDDADSIVLDKGAGALRSEGERTMIMVPLDEYPLGTQADVVVSGHAWTADFLNGTPEMGEGTTASMHEARSTTYCGTLVKIEGDTAAGNWQLDTTGLTPEDSLEERSETAGCQMMGEFTLCLSKWNLESSAF